MKNLKSLLFALATIILFQMCTQSSRAQESRSDGGIDAIALDTDRANAWEMHAIAVQSSTNGEPVTMEIGMRLPPADVPVKQVILSFSTSTRPSIGEDDAKKMAVSKNPWIRNARNLNQEGIAFIYVDISSDANGRNGFQRPTELKRDVEQAIKFASDKFPKVPINVGIFADAAVPLLETLKNIDSVKKTIIVSGEFLNARAYDWQKLSRSVLLIDAPSATCNSRPYLDARYVAQKNHFTQIKAGYKVQDSVNQCTQWSQSGLISLDKSFSEVVSKWINNEAVPSFIGYPEPQIAWHEEIVYYTVPGTFGTMRLEMTLLFPEGNGPFPIAIFNHGDIELNSSEIKLNRRFRDMIVGQEFLQQGVAVAFPSRQGIGLSEGTYLRNFSGADGDSTYKARVQAQDIFPAIEFLKKRPEVDAKRIIVTGQSSGGFCTMYVASQNPEGVIGAINFSGGRTDATTMSGPGYLNKMMVDAFHQYGQTTRVPELWIFAENDSHYLIHTIDAIYKAYTDAGGKAKLLLTPPIKMDGHFVYHVPDLWRSALIDYLKEIGIEKPSVTQASNKITITSE